MEEALLQQEFGTEWEITERPGGLRAWTALRRAGDGTPERFIVARTPGELLEKLRKLRDHDYGNGLPLDEEE